MEPTTKPSVEPSMQPSSSPSRSCRDNPDFRRNNEVLKTCDWIGLTSARRSNNCSIENVIDNCPQACRLCCDDDEDFRVETDRGNLQQCKWLSREKVRRDRYCGETKSSKIIKDEMELGYHVGIVIGHRGATFISMQRSTGMQTDT